MFNNRRLIIAQKDLLISIFNAMGKDYNSYRELVNKHDGVFKLLAAWMFARDAEEAAVLDVKNHLNEYINNKKLNPRDINVSKKSVSIGSNSFDELIAFIDFVHGNFPIIRKQEVVDNSEADMVPVLIGDGIKIYEVNSANDSRKLASDTSWCIAYPGPNNMWQSYRSNQASTFFIVFDENPPNTDQRKVALDYTNRGILITDIPNRTGKNLSNTISFEYNGELISGNDIPTYLKYLESKGVDLESTIVNPETQQEEKVLQNKPVTPEEQLESSLGQYIKGFSEKKQIEIEDIKNWAIGKFILKSPENGYIAENDDSFFQIYSKSSKWGHSIKIYKDFIVEKVPATGVVRIDSGKRNIYNSITIESDSVKTYLPKFIGMGWILPDNIFEHLFETPGGKEYLIQYVNTGLKLPESQIEKLKTDKQLFKSYTKQQLTAWSMGRNDGEIFNHLSPEDSNVRKFVIKSVNESGKFKGLPKEWINNIPQVYLLWASIGNDFEFDDPLSKKIAIAKGLLKVYQKEPTYENTKILLHVPESIESLKAEAIANDYHEKLLNPPLTFHQFYRTWNLVPEKFHNYPEFSIYKDVHDVYKNGKTYFDDVYGTKKPEITSENLKKALWYSVMYETHNNVFYKYLEFWKYYFENIDNILTGPFEKVHSKHVPLSTDFTRDEDDEEKFEFPENQEQLNQKALLYTILNHIPAKFLKDPYILEKFLEKRGRKKLIDILMKDKNDKEALSMASNYLESFDELDNVFFHELSASKNIIFQKLFEKVRTWPGENDGRLFQHTSLTDIANFLEWYPESRSKIDLLWLEFGKFFVEANRFNHYSSPNTQFLTDEYFMKYVQYLPKIFRIIPHSINRNIWTKLQYKYLVENNLIDNLDAKKTEETQIQEQDSTTAYVKTIVKIAAKMDNKKQYKIADYITNLLSDKIKI